MTLLWHRNDAGEHDPIGICVFTSAPLALSQRNRFFGRSPRRTRASVRAIDRQIVMLSRVVLHPSWRGAGVASLFVRRSCEACPWPWIETLAEMGHLNPLFERAGFVRVGTTRAKRTTRRGHSAIYGAPTHHGRRKPAVTRETFAKSRHARPVYYIFDNRGRVEG